MFKFKFYLYIVISIYVLIIIIYLNLIDISTQKKQNDAKMIECPDLKIKNLAIIQFLIKKLSDSMFSKGSMHLHFDKEECFTLFGVNNWVYEIPKLNDFLPVGDYIFKKAKNDTIKIYRNDKEYYFVLNKEINKNEKK